MAWQVTPYSIPPLAAAVLSGALVAVAWRHRERHVAAPFGALMLAVAAWSIAYAIQLGHTTLPEQLFWWRVGISIGVTVPPLWLALTLRYARRSEWLTPRVKALLVADPIAFSLVLWTSPGELIVRDAVLDESATVVELTFGPGYLAHTALAYLLVVAGIAILLEAYVRNSRLYRRQAGTLIVGAVVPLAANLAFVLGATPIPELDLTTFSFSITGGFFALALFRFDLLDRTPVARRRMIDELGDGFLVLDADERIVEANANARRILDVNDPISRPATAVLPDDARDDVVIPAASGPRQFYQLRRVALRDVGGEVAGYLIALRDVTDRTEYEQRLEVTNRLLRHNLRNEMNVILAHADGLEAELEGRRADRARTIERAAERIVDLSEKAGRLEDAIRVSPAEPTVVDAAAVVSRVVEPFRNAHSEATISFDDPGETLASVIDADLLGTAVGNLIENAIEHHDGTPCVRVSVEPGDPVRINVADDGPGIPAIEYEVLTEVRETALKHGSGVGLWLVHWIVSASHGELRFAENEPAGTVVTIELPAA